MESKADHPYFTYKGRQLANCWMPLGGIGTGTVSLTGNGKLIRWEIFNVVNNTYEVPHFFAIQCQAGKEKPVARVLNSRPGGHLIQRDIGHGGMGVFPHVQATEFHGTYPFAKINYIDKELPVTVSLEAFSPFIPHNSKDSGLPLVYFTFRFKNQTRSKVTGSLLNLCLNPIGNGGLKNPRSVLTQTHPVRQKGYRGLLYGAEGMAKTDMANGEMLWFTTEKSIAAVPCVEYMDLNRFWDYYRDSGTIDDFPVYNQEKELRTPGYNWFGAMSVPFTLRPGEETSVLLGLGWYFPNLKGAFTCSCSNESETYLGHAYNRHFSNVNDVADYAVKHQARLEKYTRRFHDTLFQSTLPVPVLDAVSANLAILRSPTVMWGEDGNIYGFEGSSCDSGCCAMNCTHVWNYEQTLAHLFPDLERTMRTLDFTVQQHDSGRIDDRYCQAPLLPERRVANHESIDGHLGCILKLYREHLRSPDLSFLKQYYPAMIKAMEYAVKTYDPKETGVPGFQQWTTHDCSLWGPNTFIGSYYLAALRAVEESAKLLGDKKCASWAGQLFLRGREQQEKRLFNGDYFVQIQQEGQPEDPMIRNYGAGCLTDQLIGQWWALLLGLGELYSGEKVRRALAAILRYNWRRPIFDFANFARSFVEADESGVIVATWPHGGQPHWPISYNSECWPGTEYALASLLIMSGNKAGETLVQDVRNRHRGDRRCPWNEIECGEFYARSLSSWSVLLALAGYKLDAPRGEITFAPRIHARSFACLCTGAEGWGMFSQTVQGGAIRIALQWRYGHLDLRKITLGNVPHRMQQLQVTLGAARLSAEMAGAGKSLTFDLGRRLRLKEGTTLEIRGRAE